LHRSSVVSHRRRAFHRVALAVVATSTHSGLIRSIQESAMSNTTFILLILSRTPSWVWGLLVVLVAIGLSQARARRLSARRATIVPLVMIGLSLFGVVSTTGAQPLALLVWSIGVGIAVALNRALRSPRGVRWDAAAQRFDVPASWLPMALILAIFCTKFAVGVSLAIDPGLRGQLAFACSTSAIYGLLSGSFFARGLALWRLARADRNTGQSGKMVTSIGQGEPA